MTISQPKRLVAYARVSTKLQENNTSIDDQFERIRAFCYGLKHEVVAEFQDVDSGSKIDRAGLQQALKAVLEDDRADGIVCCYMDRFGRDVRHFLDLVDQFNRRGKLLVFMDHQLDMTKPAEEFASTMLMAAAQLTRKQTLEKSKAAKQFLKGQGKFAGGSVPFGWRPKPRIDGKSLHQIEPDPREQLILKVIRQMADERFGPTEIAKELNKMSAVNPKWKPRRQQYKGKATAGAWHCKQIQRILERIDGEMCGECANHAL